MLTRLLRRGRSAAGSPVPGGAAPVPPDGTRTDERAAAPGTGPAEPLPTAPRAGSRTGSGRALRLAALTGLVAVVCGLSLPFAPVVVSTPTVAWPRDPARVESTLLPLTASRPLGLDVRFTCDAVRLAAGAPDATGGSGTLLATAVPGSGQAASGALVVAAVGDRVQVRARGALVLDEPLPAGPCAYHVEGRDAGLPFDVRGPPAPVGRIDPAVPVERVPAAAGGVAAPGSAVLVVRRDGREVARVGDAGLPEVDMLVSALGRVPPGSLSVGLRVDDESSSSPSPLKLALTVALAAALLATAVLLALADRGVPRAGRGPRARPRPGPTALVDGAVVATLAVWTLVAPATDDDGYFATQARNAALSGGVGDYYSFRNRSFAPFTWPYEALAAWQQLVGTAPVLQRLPAALCGLLTWLVVRRLVAPDLDAATGAAGGRVRAVVARATVAVAVLAWWLPYGMGVRPEAVVALCGVAAAAGLLAAGRRRRLAVAWLALALAGAGAAAHPAGAVAVAAVVAGLPVLAGLVGTTRSADTAVRAVAVGSGLAVGLVLGFADGALRDVLRGYAALSAVLVPDGWADEVARYTFLLDPVPMGSFAKRAAVLTCLVALAWFGVLAVAARARRVPLPPALALTGAAAALGFAALWLTPSKWTHHFGALAGVGGAFLGLLLVTGAPLARSVFGAGRIRPAVAVGLAASAAVACALVWRGPNSWAYAWLDGVPSAHARPSLGGVTADHPLAWAALTGVAALGLALGGRRSARRRAGGAAGTPGGGDVLLRAVPLVVTASLLASVAYAVGAFGVAAVRGQPPGSLWAQGPTDPTATGCGAASAVHVLDPGSAAPLPALGPAASEGFDGFAVGSGYFPGARPPPGPVWGSLTDRPGGTATTAWYALPGGLAAPDATAGTAVAVAAAGSLGDDGGAALTAVFGRRDGGGVTPAGSAPLADGDSAPHWRTFRLLPPPGADVVRLEAVDATAARHGWLAFTAPAALRAVPLARLLPADAPVALGWQLAFAHPCQRPPAVVHGVTEPPRYAVLRAGAPDAAPLDALGDIAWQADRGGVFAAVPRAQSVLALATVGPVDPYVRVYAFTSPLRPAAYTLLPGTRTVAGADTGVAG